jgi:hypothetical protein
MIEAEQDKILAELGAAAGIAGTVRPTVHTLQAQQEERGKYDRDANEARKAIEERVIASRKAEQERNGASYGIKPHGAQWAKTRTDERKPVTAAQTEKALYSLLEKASEAMLHASRIASFLDAEPPIETLGIPVPKTGDDERQPLFDALASIIVRISKAIDETEAQLKRMDEVLQ